MWHLTAAQRALLLSHTQEDKERAEKVRKAPERYSMDRILEIVRKNEERQDRVRSGEVSPLSAGEA